MKIEDNFLDQKEFDELQALIMSKDFAWYYLDGENTPNAILFEHKDSDSEEENRNKFMFAHMFYDDGRPLSPFCEKLIPIFKIMAPTAFFRIKANLITTTSSMILKAFHVDIGDISEEKLKQWTTSILYMNTNNGYTEFQDGRIAMENTIVKSVANRMVTFPANLRHRGTSCTDERTRVIINFDYFK